MSALHEHTNRPEQPTMPLPITSWPQQVMNQPRPSLRNLAVKVQDRQTQTPEVPLEFILKSLESTYVIEERAAVADFIRKNRLRGLLLQAKGAIDAAFGEAAVKRLVLFGDDEGFTVLSCMVAVSGDVQEARTALRSFDRDWWLDHVEQSEGKLNFDVDLV